MNSVCMTHWKKAPQKPKQHTVHYMGKKLLKTAASFQLFLHVTVARLLLNYILNSLPRSKYHKMSTIHTYHEKIKH